MCVSSVWMARVRMMLLSIEVDDGIKYNYVVVIHFGQQPPSDIAQQGAPPISACASNSSIHIAKHISAKLQFEVEPSGFLIQFIAFHTL